MSWCIAIKIINNSRSKYFIHKFLRFCCNCSLVGWRRARAYQMWLTLMHIMYPCINLSNALHVHVSRTDYYIYMYFVENLSIIGERIRFYPIVLITAFWLEIFMVQIEIEQILVRHINGCFKLGSSRMDTNLLFDTPQYPHRNSYTSNTAHYHYD
jgi:hypothetical protein